MKNSFLALVVLLGLAMCGLTASSAVAATGQRNVAININWVYSSNPSVDAVAVGGVATVQEVKMTTKQSGYKDLVPGTDQHKWGNGQATIFVEPNKHYKVSAVKCDSPNSNIQSGAPYASLPSIYVSASTTVNLVLKDEKTAAIAKKKVEQKLAPIGD